MIVPFIHYVILVKISHYIDPTMWTHFSWGAYALFYETDSHLWWWLGLLSYDFIDEALIDNCKTQDEWIIINCGSLTFWTIHIIKIVVTCEVLSYAYHSLCYLWLCSSEVLWALVLCRKVKNLWYYGESSSHIEPCESLSLSFAVFFMLFQGFSFALPTETSLSQVCQV